MQQIPQEWLDQLAGNDPRLSAAGATTAREVIDAMYALANALTYPQDHHGNTIDLTYILAPLAYHLALAGVRVHPEKALIKQRPIPGQGVVEGACEWVGVDEPDAAAPIDGAITLERLAAMSPAEQAAAMQQYGLSAQPNTDAGWHTKTRITQEDS